MSRFLSLARSLDHYTGIEDSFICLVIVVFTVMACFGYDTYKAKRAAEKLASIQEEEEEKEPPRNFTLSQLRYFDGKKDPKNPDEDKPLYLSLAGRVFDVSTGREYYGPGSSYEFFAGRECGVAFAKFSFDLDILDDFDGLKDLNFMEKEELYNWIERFYYYRAYPELGFVVVSEKIPSSDRIITKEELEKNNGSMEVPDGYAATPIYVALKNKVYDVSFGGVSMYGEGGPYNKFAGKDVSRALAKMSFDLEDLENTDISDLSEKQLKVLDDWCKTFEEKKQYPCVGRLK